MAGKLPEVAELLLGPLLRFVSEEQATIWVETDSPCEVNVLGSSALTFHCPDQANCSPPDTG